ncbi:hypothetical protein SHIRM173S_10955 [Streptomyces hirsutus]
MQVPGEAQPLLRDGHPGHLGAGVVDFADQVGEPGEAVDDQPGQRGGDGVVARLQSGHALRERPGEHRQRDEGVAGPGDPPGQQEQNRSGERSRHTAPDAADPQDGHEGQGRLHAEGGRFTACGPPEGAGRDEQQLHRVEHDDRARADDPGPGARHLVLDVEEGDDAVAREDHRADSLGEPGRQQVPCPGPVPPRPRRPPRHRGDGRRLPALRVRTRPFRRLLVSTEDVVRGPETARHVSTPRMDVGTMRDRTICRHMPGPGLVQHLHAIYNNRGTGLSCS